MCVSEYVSREQGVTPELKSSEQRNPRSGEELEKVRSNMNFGGEL